ncbi:MAG TPA: IS1595 family transposase [Fimbriimonadaceae bacterium]|jgi:transposase-like protein
MIDINFPKSEFEFHERFKTEEECREYLYNVRWPKGFVCPYCGSTKKWPRRANRDGIICGDCQKETSLRAGTILHNSSKPLKQWLMAMFHMTNNKQAISALRLQKLMGFGSINTAIRWLRELRRSMGSVVEHHKLCGEVEADEANIAGKREGGKRGKGAHPDRMLVMVERLETGCGRARIKYIKGYAHAQIRHFIDQVVEKGAVLHTDGERAYRSLDLMGYIPDSRVITHTRGKDKGKTKKLDEGKKSVLVHLPRVHRVISLVKRVILGAYQGRYSERHVQSYLDEYCFRFNRRNDKRPLALFQRLAPAIFDQKAVPYWKSSGRPYNKKPADGQPYFVRDQRKVDRINAWRALAKEDI